MNYIENIRLEDLPLEHQDLAMQIGLAAYRNLVRIYGGESIHVACQSSVTIEARNRDIFSRFQQGKDYKELAKTFGMSQRHIRNIINEMEAKSWKKKPQ